MAVTNKKFLLLVGLSVVLFHQYVYSAVVSADDGITTVDIPDQDPCDIECEDNHKCFLHKQKDDAGVETIKGLCVPAHLADNTDILTDNSHVKLHIECPKMKEKAWAKEAVDCGPYTGRKCENDLECDNQQKICCTIGCWKECVDPVFSRYP